MIKHQCLIYIQTTNTLGKKTLHLKGLLITDCSNISCLLSYPAVFYTTELHILHNNIVELHRALSTCEQNILEFAVTILFHIYICIFEDFIIIQLFSGINFFFFFTFLTTTAIRILIAWENVISSQQRWALSVWRDSVTPGQNMSSLLIIEGTLECEMALKGRTAEGHLEMTSAISICPSYL